MKRVRQDGRAFERGRIVRHDFNNAVRGDAEKSWASFRASWGDNNFNNIYRVSIDPTTGQSAVICLGLDTIDAEAEGIYANTSQLPDWMQGKLAVLALMKVDPPQTKVEDVGMRVDENTYWVVGVRDDPKPME